MSLLKVKIPQSNSVIETIKDEFISRYGSFLESRYNIENITNLDWFNNLLDFMLHPYEERIDYHNIRENHIFNLWLSEIDAIDFFKTSIILNMGKNLNKFDYYFQEKTAFINVSNIGSNITEVNTNKRDIVENGSSFGMNEISPINASITTFNTPNNKAKSEAKTTKNDIFEEDRNSTNTEFDSIIKFIKFNSYEEYEDECYKSIDSIIYEYNVIY